MNMLKRIGIALVAVLGIFILLVLIQPNDFRIERKISIQAPARVIFAQVSDFHKWNVWSPWAKLDPKMKTTHSGSGIGSTYSWVGNDQVGEGKMTLLEATPFKSIKIQLDFLKPMQAQNETVFAFAAEGQNTQVIWSMTGKNNFFSKIFSVFGLIDKMVGADFEKGLAQLKSITEVKK